MPVNEPNPSLITRIKARWEWRHAIILFASLIAAEQSRAATMGYLQYLQIEEQSIHGEVGSLLPSIRQKLKNVRGHESRQEALQEFFYENQHRGLVYIALRSSRDGTMVEAGTRDIAPSLDQMISDRDFSRSGHNLTLDDDKVFAFVPEFSQIFYENRFDPRLARRKRGRGRPRDEAPLGELPPDPRAGDDGQVPLSELSEEELLSIIDGFPPIQIIEFAPKQTLALRERTIFTTLVGLLGALLTLIGGLYIWWLIGKRAQAEREAEERRMLATLGKMSAVISHELRNPLAGAKGQADLLIMMLEDGEKTHAKATQIQHELTRLEELSETLLAFVNSRRITPSKNQCAQLITDLTRLASDDRLVIDTEHMPTAWFYDPVTLVRALDNIIDNALSYTNNDGVVTLAITQKHNTLHLTIRDGGPGFDETIDVFEPFVTTRVHGTGLGMAIAAEVVRAHNGTISANNHPDGGAVVHITLPDTT